ncbi:MAG: SPFH domain-containing protein [Clostridia bacterium]|nr:SPFH domain-containing protein [Clostridia bacterium]
MGKFIIACPVCHSYVQASTGFFASKHIQCSCGNVIHVKTDRMTTKTCPSCGNNVVYDQAEGTDAKCPVCRQQLVTEADYGNLVHFRCETCGCELQASKGAAHITCPVCDTVADVQKEIKRAEVRDKGVPAVIRYEGANDTFVWKHPLTDFTTGSRLIVHESQEAVFFRNGEALDSFGPGGYTLETGVMPKTEALYRLPVDGQPFHAEVYFVNLTTQAGIKWGTPSKVGLFDPATGMHVELGASGAFNMRVTDARKLLIKLVGTAGGLTQGDLFGEGGAIGARAIGGYFRTMIAAKVKANLARVIKQNSISVLELDMHLDAIAAAMKAAIDPELSEYGLEMPEFYVANIVTPDDDPNFRRMKQQHADLYLKTKEEAIKKAEAEAAFERKAVEAQTAARMKVIGAQGDADALRIQAQAEADAYRMQAEAEAMEMKMKGYTYQQETARQVGTEAVRNGGAGGLGTIAGDAMQLGIGLGVMGGVIGMTKEAVSPLTQQAGGVLGQAAGMGGWTCACGAKNITSNFCPECGAKKPAPAAADAWDCACGAKGITSRFCPECGAKKPEAPAAWSCACGATGITSKFCPECGAKKPEAPAVWDCACGNKGVTAKFCPECGGKRPE